jgi:hypothetical protein
MKLSARFVRDGKIVRCRILPNHEKALEAVGLAD